MTELSFLIDLLLNEKLSKSVKDKIAVRVREVEEEAKAFPMQRNHAPFAQALPPPKMINGAVQSPSTVAAMEREAGAPPPIGAVVASPAAAQAMARRNQALNESINATHNSKPPAGQTSPKKW